MSSPSSVPCSPSATGDDRAVALRRADVGFAAALPPRRRRAAGGARPVRHVRQRPVPGRHRRPRGLGRRRLHDVGDVPVLAVRRRSSGAVGQLRPRVAEGDGRRLRRHGPPVPDGARRQRRSDPRRLGRASSPASSSRSRRCRHELRDHLLLSRRSCSPSRRSCSAATTSTTPKRCSTAPSAGRRRRRRPTGVATGSPGTVDTGVDVPAGRRPRPRRPLGVGDAVQPRRRRRQRARPRPARRARPRRPRRAGADRPGHHRPPNPVARWRRRSVAQSAIDADPRDRPAAHACSTPTVPSCSSAR